MDRTGLCRLALLQAANEFHRAAYAFQAIPARAQAHADSPIGPWYVIEAANRARDILSSAMARLSLAQEILADLDVAGSAT